jgi:3-methyladenine DNA glycosylase/8-oxoguanine DNA glycosylase
MTAPERRWVEAERSLAAADPAFGALIARVGPCSLEPHGLAPYDALVQSIVYQQLSGKAAATILGRALAHFGGEVPDPRDLADAPDELLRGAGLSRAKTAALKDLARRAMDGSLPGRAEVDTLGDDEIVSRLSQVRGVGPWTAQMYLMFGLARPDVLADTDLGVQNGVAVTLGVERPGPAALRDLAEGWRPWRTVGCWYMWRAVDLARKGAG